MELPKNKKITDKPVLHMQLCANRHDCPQAVDGAIFPQIVEDIHNFDALRQIAREAIPYGCRELVVYVTGLTPCLCAVITVCNQRCVDLTCAHFDKESDTYRFQYVL